MTNDELARREERAQHGIIEFAEEMQAIRDDNLYPGAKSAPDAWKSYCKERWGMSKSTVDEHIKAVPVLKRYATLDMSSMSKPSVTAASRVATLPEPVQDAILAESPKRNDASDKAKAVRREAKRIEQQEGREPTTDELVKVAQAQPTPKRKPKRKHHSRFTSLLAQAVALTEDAADYAQANALTDIENEYGWSRVEKLRLHADRIADMLTRPDHVRDWDDEAAALLGGEQ
jgi:hypothetical protein